MNGILAAVACSLTSMRYYCIMINDCNIAYRNINKLLQYWSTEGASPLPLENKLETINVSQPKSATSRGVDIR